MIRTIPEEVRVFERLVLLSKQPEDLTSRHTLIIFSTPEPVILGDAYAQEATLPTRPFSEPIHELAATNSGVTVSGNLPS